MASADFPQLLKRLEQVTLRLEDIAQFKAANTPSALLASSNAASKSAVGLSSAMLEGFDELLNGPTAKFIEISAQIGSLVHEQAMLFKKAIDAQRSLLQTTTLSKKPTDQQQFQQLLQPTVQVLSQITELKDKNRPSPLFNHLSAVAEGVPALGWVGVEPKPVPYVGEMKDAAMFYTNRILKEFKDKDKLHVEWAQIWVQVLLDLQAFVKKFHTTGLVWNPQGSHAPIPAAAAATPPAVTTDSANGIKIEASKLSGSGLFAELNKGGDITSGLKKVEKSQMTHKNPSLRVSSVVKANELGPVPGLERSASGTQQQQKKPPKLALEGNKWYVEHHEGNSNIVLDEVDMKQGAYIYGCNNCTIQIKGKISAVTLDSCKKTALVVENVVSSLDIVNCQTIQCQILGRAPTAVVDKTDGLNLFLSKECLDIEIFTAKSSELNLSIPPAKQGGDYVERPISEQLRTVIVNGMPVSTIVDHKS